MIATAFGFLFSPTAQWKKVAALSDEKLRIYLLYPVILGIIPAVAWYHGTTNTGWTVGTDEPIFLTSASALRIAILFYLTEILAIWTIGGFIHWMSATYNATSTLIKGVAIAGFTTTPFLIGGAVGLFPILWLDILIALLAVTQSVYLLYKGIPIVMKIPAEQGFLFASAMIAVGMVILICIMCGTVILWDMGFAPIFTD
jgi:hypothetical protein